MINGQDGFRPEAFRWTVDRDGGFVRVALTGELDVDTADDFDEALQSVEREASVLLLDLGDLSFIDSSGLRVLIRSNRRLESAGARLVVGAASAAVERALDISGLNRIIEGIEGPARETPRPRKPWE